MMSPTFESLIPVAIPRRLPDLFSGPTPPDRLATLFTRSDLDAAIDRAARISRSTVAAFAAAPCECWDERDGVTDPIPSACVEFVVEFFVPPAATDLFHRELEAQLLRCNPAYVTGRYRGDFAPCALHAIPAGTFHQHRIATRTPADDQREARWSPTRALLDALLHQSRIGWRELGA